jgi:hypothetical protein
MLATFSGTVGGQLTQVLLYIATRYNSSTNYIVVITAAEFTKNTDIITCG